MTDSPQPIKLIDMHSHWGTKRGWTGGPLEDENNVEAFASYFRWQPHFVTEQEMVDYFRESNVRVMLDLAFEAELPVEVARDLHDYAFEVQRNYPDVIIGNWVRADPRRSDHLEELERCIEARSGYLGFGSGGIGTFSDSFWDPAYSLCAQNDIPVLMSVGMTGPGAGIPGGLGIVLEDRHPRHVDQMAAKYPELKIIAGRPAWPWQPDMIAVLLHKGNVWNELHGWSPKYHPPELKYEISRRLKDKIMFGADYPMLSYERLVSDWRAEGYSDEILQNVFHRNAQRFLESLRQSVAGS